MNALIRWTRLHRQARRCNRFRLALALGAAGLALASGVAQAVCVLCSCTITSSALGFGSYDTLSATPLAGTSTLSFSCSAGVSVGGIPFTVALNKGSGSFATRTMKNGGNTLNYNLYTTVAHTTIWGDTTMGTATVSSTYPFTNAPPVVLTVYGLIPAQQNVLALSSPYQDTITATVTF